jgi:hypothetical protein
LIPFSFRFRVIKVKEKRERSAGAGKTDKRGFLKAVGLNLSGER